MFPQETLDNLRKAMANTHIMCATMLDTKVRSSSCQHSDRPGTCSDQRSGCLAAQGTQPAKQLD